MPVVHGVGHVLQGVLAPFARVAAIIRRVLRHSRVTKTDFSEQLGTGKFLGIGRAHLSKRPSDLKQNGTQEKTQFSGTVFHTLSHDVFHFVASGSFTNH